MRLLLVGDGPVYDELIRNGLEEFVYEVGFVPDPIRYLQTADTGFLPSRYRGAESMPNSIVESFFAGKPVVASEVREVRNMMTLDGEIVGAVIPLVDWAVDLDAAALVVAKFASDPSEYQRVNSLVPGLAQRFAIDTVVDHYVEVFKKAMQR